MYCVIAKLLYGALQVLVLSAVVPLNITMSPLENGSKNTVSHSLCPPFHCCVLAPMPEHLVKFNSSQTRETELFFLTSGSRLVLEMYLILVTLHRYSTHNFSMMHVHDRFFFHSIFQMDI